MENRLKMFGQINNEATVMVNIEQMYNKNVKANMSMASLRPFLSLHRSLELNLHILRIKGNELVEHIRLGRAKSDGLNTNRNGDSKRGGMYFHRF